MEQPILAFEQVTGTSKKFHLENISFALHAGYIMGLMGSNGAGKTTLLRYIMEDRQCYTGTIRINGVDIRENHAYRKNQIGYVSEDNRFLLERTAEQNVTILSGFYEDFDKDLFHSAMQRMELSPKKTYGRMSRGECLKFQMAFAMAHHPVLYLLDEVTAGMDPVFRVELFRILQDIIKEEKASVLMTSHIASEMERKADFVGILECGKLLQFGESMDVIPKSGQREVGVSKSYE